VVLASWMSGSVFPET